MGDASYPELTARFASERKRINVAISRARDLLVLVGHPEFMESAPNLATIIAYAATIGGLVDATEAQEWAEGYHFEDVTKRSLLRLELLCRRRSAACRCCSCHSSC